MTLGEETFGNRAPPVNLWAGFLLVMNSLDVVIDRQENIISAKHTARSGLFLPHSGTKPSLFRCKLCIALRDYICPILKYILYTGL